MSNYWKRLKSHPGVEVACVMTGLGGFIGIAGDGVVSFEGFLYGASIMGLVCWPIVLLTARSQPLPEDEKDG